MTKRLPVVVAALAALLTLSACGNGGDASSQHDTHTADGGAEFNDADVEFATGMIQHHAQALAMVDLTLGRELDPEVTALAEQIRMAQSPEIEQMTTWLTEWDQPVPETVRDHANAHGDGSAHMNPDLPGMMSDQEMADLEAARGDEFQRRWLAMMIEHHEGAIEMAESERGTGHFAPAMKMADRIATTQQQEIETMQGLT
jgi:uncharacterized protein (DUF305 family)